MGPLIWAPTHFLCPNCAWAWGTWGAEAYEKPTVGAHWPNPGMMMMMMIGV